MIDAAQIQHLSYDTGILKINFGGDHVVEYKGPFAIKVMGLIRTEIEKESDLYDKNAALLESSYNNMKSNEGSTERPDFDDLDNLDWL